jgi:small membrane protein
VDLILYLWVVISLLLFLNLHIKLRSQNELVTCLTRATAISEASRREALYPPSQVGASRHAEASLGAPPQPQA